jgi:hypothetical protein
MSPMSPRPPPACATARSASSAWSSLGGSGEPTLRRIAGAGRQNPGHPGREKCRLLTTTRIAWPMLITTTMSPCPHTSPQFSERHYYYFLTTVILFS